MMLSPYFKLNGQSYTQKTLKQYALVLKQDPSQYLQDTGRFLLDWLSNTPVITVQTSGSTGKPKTIVLEKQKMIASAKATATYFKLPKNTTALHCLPSKYIAGKMMLVRAMVLGWHLDVVAPSTNPLAQVEKSYNFAAMIPVQAQQGLSRLACIEKLIIGGASVGQSLREKLQDISTYVYETYGMTETISHIAIKPINHSVQTYFTALDEVFFSLDARGCLEITAPRVCDEKQITNDLVTLHNNRQFTWLSRIDFVINSGGVKLFPEQIEQKLASFISIPFFVSAVEDAVFQEKVIVIAKGSVAQKKQVLNQIAKCTSLSKIEMPKALYMVDAFIQTPNQKLDRYKTKAYALQNRV